MHSWGLCMADTKEAPDASSTWRRVVLIGVRRFPESSWTGRYSHNGALIEPRRWPPGGGRRVPVRMARAHIRTHGVPPASLSPLAVDVLNEAVRFFD